MLASCRIAWGTGHQTRDKLRNKIRCHMGKTQCEISLFKLFRDLHILTLL